MIDKYKKGVKKINSINNENIDYIVDCKQNRKIINKKMQKVRIRMEELKIKLNELSEEKELNKFAEKTFKNDYLKKQQCIEHIQKKINGIQQ